MKKIFIMIFCAMLLSSMVACGNKKENNNQEANTTTQSETTTGQEETTSSDGTSTEKKDDSQNTASGNEVANNSDGGSIGSEGKKVADSDGVTITEYDNKVVLVLREDNIYMAINYNFENNKLKSFYQECEFSNTEQSEIEESKKLLESNGFTNVKIDGNKLTAEQNNITEEIDKETLIEKLKDAYVEEK